MAQSIGSKISGALVGILIGLLVVSFAVWGVNDAFSPSAKDAVMTLGDEDISRTDFERAFRRELVTMAQSEGRQMTHREAYDRGIHTQILSRLMTQKVIEIDSQDLGVGINSKSARDYAATIDAFKDELTGEFSLQKLQQVLAQQNPPITQAQFEEELVLDLRQQQTLPAISGGVQAPLEFAEIAYRYMTEQRRVQVLTFNQTAIEAAPEPTDEQLEAYIEQNAATFTAPEYRRVTILRLEPQDVAPNLNVSEDELRDHFRFKIDRGDYGSPETRSLVQITADSQVQADAAVERLNTGEDPLVVATNLDLIEPITFDNVTPDGVLDPETATVAFEMADQEARTVLGSLGKWYAVKVTNINPKVEPNFEALRDELTQDLLNNKAQDQIFDLTEIIESELDDGNPIEDAARAANVPFASIDYFDRRGLTQAGDSLDGLENIAGLAKDDTILTEIFISDVGFETDLFKTETDGWAAVRVDDILPSQMRPFAEVRDQAARLWKAEYIQDRLDEKMVELASRARNGESLDAIAADVSGDVSVDEVIFVRSTPSENLGRVLSIELLDADVGDVERGNGPTPQSRQIAVLNDIVRNSDGLGGQIGDLLQAEVTSAIRQDLLFAYQNAVLDEHPQREYPDQVLTALGLDTQNEE